METIRTSYTAQRAAFEAIVEGWPPSTPGGTAHGLSVQAWFDAVARHPSDGQTRDPYGAELIYSYWLEEGGLLQAMEAVALRFQNRSSRTRDTLAGLDISPLRPIGDSIWAYIDDQHRRLGLQRRAYEYAHQYGLRLVGKAVGRIRPADDRSPFLSSFHTLLNVTLQFYRDVDDQQIQQDARPVLNALRELQMILLQGSSNQFSTITIQARVECMIAQWLLTAPEIQKFLGAPTMISYPESWMEPVDALRRLLQWGDTSIIEFWRLAAYGELLISSVRWGNFGPAANNPQDAEDWAMTFRNFTTQYVASYCSVTRVDLSQRLVTGQPVDATLPSVYLAQREAEYRRLRAG